MAQPRFDPGQLRALVEEGLSIRSIAARVGASYTAVRYRLAKEGLETVPGVRRRESHAARQAGMERTHLCCPKHGMREFFIRREGGYRCAKCNAEAVSERRRVVKRQLVEEAGGRCRLCGFSEHPAALQFHHVHPEDKEFQLGARGHSRGIARLRAEARKCVLLCANCHALVEAGVKKSPGLDR